jgi:hypothetical protein
MAELLAFGNLRRDSGSNSSQESLEEETFEGTTIASAHTANSAPSSSATLQGVLTEDIYVNGYKVSPVAEASTPYDVPFIVFESGTVPFRHVKELGQGS